MSNKELSKAELEKMVEAPIKIDRERMDKALASEMHVMPSGLSREEKRAYIISVAKKACGEN